eukprot:SAG11_NODE_26160_length_349_cov_0.540000_1_plen_113_part_10
MRLGKIFAGFTDHISFDGSVLPTFKMVRGKTYRFYGQRVPSFTDRILSKSAPGAMNCFRKDAFGSVPSIATSDHKPVFARFYVSVPTPFIERSGGGASSDGLRCVLRFDNLKY